MNKMNYLSRLLTPYKIFVSHSWSYPDSYDRLMQMLNNKMGFSYQNFSVPKDNPIHYAQNDTTLYQAIKSRVDQVDVILILAGVYATHSKWINLEIKAAKSSNGLLGALSGYMTNKPIIAVEEWGALKTSGVVKDNANEVVGWNSDSIIDAIKRLVRR